MIVSRLLAAIFSLFFVSIAAAQDFSNKGTEFWVGYGYHQGMVQDNNQNMVLYFTSDVNTIVKVEIPALGWVRTYNVIANKVVESDPMPKEDGGMDARLIDEKLYKTGIHITSVQPVVAYAHTFSTNVSGASLLLPVSTLGQEYYSLNFTQKSNTNASSSWAFVVATEDNTVVEIIPSAKTLTHAAGVSFSVILNKGEVYNLMGDNPGQTGFLTTGSDLTGTIIRSVSNGTSGCKRIAVFSGSGRIYINCDNADQTHVSSDNLFQQAFPKVAWGKKYLTVPTEKLLNNPYRIVVSDPATIVTVNGNRLNNLTGLYYEFSASTPQNISSDKPIMVAQYISSADGCSNSSNKSGDPEMIYLSPIEQTLDQVTLNSTNHFDIKSHYINVVIKTSAKNSFTLDGKNISSSFSTDPTEPNYSFAVLSVDPGVHNLKADSGFNAIAYGYGIFESYGYNAGTNIKNLNQSLSLQNEYIAPGAVATCNNRPFSILLTLPYQPSSLAFDFLNNPNLVPSTAVLLNNPPFDSTFVSDGQHFFVYKLATKYKYRGTGGFAIKVTANNQTSDGCNGLQELTYNVTVVEPPQTDFSFSHLGCVTDSVSFIDATKSSGRPIIKWSWQYPNGRTDTLKNSHTLFTQAGTYNIKHTAVNDIGCATDTTKAFTIAPQPVAKFEISKLTCEKSVITFNDLSTINTGKIVKWFWNFGNNETVTNSTNAPVSKVYEVAGEHTVSLQVENESGCKSEVFTTTFTVHPSPIVQFNTSGACSPYEVARFENLTTIDDGTAPGLTYRWDFGDQSFATDKNPAHIYNAGGPFSVNLKATATSGCSKDSTITFSNIYQQPSSAFNYNPQTICQSDSVHFIDASVAKNSKAAKWAWAFSDGTTAEAQNPVHKFADSGTYIITLYITSTAGCNSDTIKKAIYINKPPTAAFSISESTCVNQPFTIASTSKANSGSIKNWVWSYSDGSTESFTNGNAFDKTFKIAGKYQISLVVESDRGCKSDTAVQTAVVKPLPIANFIVPDVCVNDAFADFRDSTYMPANSGAATFTYSWNFGDPNSTPSNPNTSLEQNPKHHYSSSGIFKVSLTATSNSGCSATVTKNLSVNGVPKANFTFIDDGISCSNKNVQIKNTSSIDIGSITKVQLIWDTEGNPTAIETDPSPVANKVYNHQYPVTTTIKTYRVKMIVFSGTNCYDEKVLSLTINPSPKVVFSPVTAICLNEVPHQITEVKETSGIVGSFAFSGKGITSTGLFDPSIAGPGPTAITYTYISTAGCRDSASQVIQVIANPVVKILSPVRVLEGGSAELNPTVTGDAVKFIWSPSTYLNNATIKNAVSTPKDSITYQLLATSVEGCKGSGSVSILILKSLGIPNAFSPNADGVNDVWAIASLQSYINCSVEVFNRYGAKVFNSIGYSNPWDGSVSGRPLPVGVYYYVINLKNGSKPYTGFVTILK